MWIRKKNLDKIVSKLISDIFIYYDEYTRESLGYRSSTRKTLIEEINKIVMEKTKIEFNNQYIKNGWTIRGIIEEYIKSEEFFDRLINKINNKQLDSYKNYGGPK